MAFGPEENKNTEAPASLSTIEAALFHQNARAAATITGQERSSRRGEESSAGAVMLADAFARYGDLKQYGFFFSPLLGSV